MKSEPISVAGVAGPIVVTTNAFWGHPAVTVGGVPAPRTGRRRYALPAASGGAIDATVRNAFADPYPTVEVNGVPHRTGPAIPVILRALVLLPILLVAVGGALGGLIGALGVGANLAVARLPIPSAAKAAAMLGVTVVASVVWLAVALAIGAAVSGS
ncbi:hypothetical protein [Micromonospora sp. WMMD710]|uniref:hypothetical protein n=1 Tax=Micromonospora sp. WMMD710 TaxID=3016085 RepID=UPI002417C347|nr:hypothetical protein [Micromonospora sp. WMMD710]MDG4758511.1 hypothetical protein [Micromonospora sp. WMMD710]